MLADGQVFGVRSALGDLRGGALGWEKGRVTPPGLAEPASGEGVLPRGEAAGQSPTSASQLCSGPGPGPQLSEPVTEMLCGVVSKSGSLQSSR